ncbi:unnamed protein product, partial [Rotaria magnacalcarata]
MLSSRERWDQERLNDFEGIPPFGQLSLTQYEFEQLLQVEAIEIMQQTADFERMQQIRRIIQLPTPSSQDLVEDQLEQEWDIDIIQRSQEQQQIRDQNQLEQANSSNNNKTTNNDENTSFQAIYGNSHLDAIDSFRDFDSLDDDNQQLKQDCDLDKIHTIERLIDDDTASDSQEDDDVEEMDVEDEIVVTQLKQSPTSSSSSTKKTTKSIDEHVVSQKLSQISTSSNKQQSRTASQPRSKEDKMYDLTRIPVFLAKNDKSLLNLLNEVLGSNNASSSNQQLEDYRQMAILIYRIKHSEILQSLWTTCQKSGSGQLNTQLARNRSGPLFWPKPIKSMVKVTIRSGSTEEHDACLAYVKIRLVESQKIIEESHIQLKLQINRLSSIYSSKIRQAMDTFVKQQLTGLRMKIEHKVKLLHYDYDEHILQLEYLQQQPTQTQIQLAEELCTVKQPEELSKYTSELLEQQIIHHNASSSPSTIAQVPLFDSITDTNIRQQFYDQYRHVIEPSKTDMFTLYTKSATTQKQHYENQYDDKMKQIEQEQK